MCDVTNSYAWPSRLNSRPKVAKLSPKSKHFMLKFRRIRDTPGNHATLAPGRVLINVAQPQKPPKISGAHREIGPRSKRFQAELG